MSTDKISLRLDPDVLTLGDLEDFEDYVGKAFEDAIRPRKQFDEDGAVIKDEKGRPELSVKLSQRAITALAWIVTRKTRPDFTVEDARNTRVEQLEFEDAPDDDPAGKE